MIFNWIKNIKKCLITKKINIPYLEIIDTHQGNLSFLINFSINIKDSGLFSNGTICPAFLMVIKVKPSKSTTLPAF